MNRLGVVLCVLLFTIGIVNAGCAGYVAGPKNNPPAAPSITTQPANQTVAAGQMPTFAVVAAGTPPLSYQWKKNESPTICGTTSCYTDLAMTCLDVIL